MEIIVRDDFHGLVKIYFECADGIGIEETDNRYIYHIPESGVLAVQGKNPEFVLHRIAAKRESGAVLGVVSGAGDAPPTTGAVMLWTFASSPPDGKPTDAWFLVGTVEDEAKLKRRSLDSLSPASRAATTPQDP